MSLPNLLKIFDYRDVFRPVYSSCIHDKWQCRLCLRILYVCFLPVKGDVLTQYIGLCFALFCNWSLDAMITCHDYNILSNVIFGIQVETCNLLITYLSALGSTIEDGADTCSTVASIATSLNTNFGGPGIITCYSTTFSTIHIWNPMPSSSL